MFFEGPEKKLEIILSSSYASLRSQGREFWEEVCRSVGAQVFSVVSNESCEAYLLSESSLFVYDHRLTMITCGQTSLVKAVDRLLETYPLDGIQNLIYERKNEHFPQYQPSSFYDDVKFLKQHMPGRAYRFGNPDDHHLFLFYLDRTFEPSQEDMTLEVLMHGIDEEAQQLFAQGANRDQKEIHQKTGVTEILPGFKIDDYVFHPNGYSLNAINGNTYYTIHVTPEQNASYVSFETNHFLKSKEVQDVVYRVLEIFRPKSCDVVLFHPQELYQLEHKAYFLKDRFESLLNCGYNVQFHHYFRHEHQPLEPKELRIEST